MYGVNIIPFCEYTVNFWDSYNVFWNFVLTILFKHAKLNIEKKKKSRSEKGKQTSFF